MINFYDFTIRGQRFTEPHEGQRAVLESDARFKVLCCGRRWAKSTLEINTLLEQGFLNSGHTYWYVGPTFRQAKTIAWRYLMSRINMLPKHIRKNIRVNETNLSIELDNGTIIELKGVERPDNLLGTGLDGVVLDEYAVDTFGSSPIWKEIIRPSLSDKHGWAIIASCITKDTMILPNTGLQEMGTSPAGYSDTGEVLYGKGGFHRATHRYGSPYSSTKKIRTKFGFEIEATPNHKLLTPNGWVRMDKMEKGVPLYLQHNQNVYGEKFSTEYEYSGRKLLNKVDIEYNEDLAYFIGLVVSEGFWDRGRICISNSDREVVDFLKQRGFVNYGKDGVHWTFSSKKLCEFLDYIGLEHGAKNKNVPNCILQAPENIQVAFLQGCFDGDGNGDSQRARVAYTTTSEILGKQLQVMLLNMGILAKRSEYVSKPSKRVSVFSHGYRLTMENYAAYLFYEKVGFRVKRKMEGQKHCTPLNTYKTWIDRKDFGRFTQDNGLAKMSYLTREKKCELHTLEQILGVYPNEKYDLSLLADEVVDVVDSEGFTYDFFIPDTHQYFSNGFISHNTPRGYNHFFEMFDYAEKDTTGEWEAWRFPSSVNPALSKKELESARKELGEDLYAQEYLAEFRKRSGLVYANFDRDTHVIKEVDPDIISPRWSLEVGIDFGGAHPTAAVFVLFSQNDDTAYIVDEYYESNISSDKHLEALKAKENYWLGVLKQQRPRVRWGDSQAKQLIMDYARAGYHITPTIKGRDSVQVGIDEVKKRLNVDMVTKKPKLYITSNCVNTIREFENYVWITGSSGSAEEDDMMRLAAKKKDAPRKVFDDAMDALRYVIRHHVPVSSQGVVKSVHRERDPFTGI